MEAMSGVRINRMMPALYEAAVKGNVEDYYKALRVLPPTTTSYKEVGFGVDGVTTPGGDTVLHIATQHGQKDLVEKILTKKEGNSNEQLFGTSSIISLLLAKNNSKETALHCAAEIGYEEIARVLINAARDNGDEDVEANGAYGVVKRMIRMKDIVGDTALHKAARMGHQGVVMLLVKEDSEFEYRANDDGETPIYLAAEWLHHQCLIQILNTCKNIPTYGGPLGRNALHAAILSGIRNGSPIAPRSVRRKNYEWCSRGADGKECIKALLERETSLCEMRDEFGWTPLHYAVQYDAYSYFRLILKINSGSAVYIRAGSDDGEWTTAFHIAAKARNKRIEMMEEMLEKCPDCWEMVNSKGQNVLHEAALAFHGFDWNVISYILEKSPRKHKLVMKKDEDGNTPLHLLAANGYGYLDPVKDFYLPRELRHQPLLFNKQHQTPIDVASQHSKFGKSSLFTKNEEGKNEREKEEKGIEKVIKSSQTNILVATLIATITFAAGFTVPGGNNDDKGGEPRLLRRASFKTFVVANTLAFMLSIVAIFAHIDMAMIEAKSSSPRKYRKVYNTSKMESQIILYASMALVIAFGTGIYATLASSAPPLAFAVLFFGSAYPFLVIYFKLVKIWNPV